MSLKPEIEEWWRAWKGGVFACFIIALSIFGVIAGSFFLAAVVLMPFGWIFGLEETEAERIILILASVIGFLVGPLIIAGAVEKITADKEDW